MGSAMTRDPRLVSLTVLALGLAGCTPRPAYVAWPGRPSTHRISHAQRPPNHELTEAQKDALFRQFSDYEARRDAGSSEAGK